VELEREWGKDPKETSGIENRLEKMEKRRGEEPTVGERFILKACLEGC
jgi:hypothetical protein